MYRKTTSFYVLISISLLLFSGCASTKNNSTEKTSNNQPNKAIIATGSGVAVALLVNPLAGVVVGFGTYYVLEDEKD